MSLSSAVTSPQYTQLRSASHSGEYILSLMSNRVVFAGQVNSDLTTPQTWLQFNYNNVTTGAYTDVELGQVLLIGVANDITKATFRGRVSLVHAPSATIMYCNESSADFVVGAYFWVIDTYDPAYRLSKMSGTTQLVDGDVAFQRNGPVIRGLRTGYAGNVATGTGKLRLALDVTSSYSPESGRTIASYLFSFKAASYTVISGALATGVVTVDINPGEQWGKLVVTDSAGITSTRRFAIKAHDVSNPADTGFSGPSLSDDLQKGWSASIPFFAGVNSVMDRTFGILWKNNETYGGVAGPLDTTNNTAFVGWMIRESDTVSTDETYSALSDAKMDFLGVAAMLQRLKPQKLPFLISASPALWGDIYNLTPWRTIVAFLQNYTNILTLCDLAFDSVDETYLFSAMSSQGTTVLGEIQAMAGQINALVQFAPDGRIEVARDVTFLSSSARSALTTVANWQAQDYIGDIVRNSEPAPSVGIVDGSGATYSSASGALTPYTARSPGHAQGEADGQDQLPGQILQASNTPTDGLIDLRQRTGNKFSYDNTSETLDVTHPGGYNFLIAARNQLYTWTIDTTATSSTGVQRIIYDTTVLWTLESVSEQIGDNGDVQVKAKYRRVSAIGDPGDDTTVVDPGTVDPSFGDFGFPAFNFEDPSIGIPDIGLTLATISPALLTPPPGKVSTFKGQDIIACSPTVVYVFRNFINLTRPQVRIITPPTLGAYKCVDVKVSPFFNSTTIPAYLLATDGTNSAVWYTPNCMAGSVTWTKGADVTGLYEKVVPTHIFSDVLLYSAAGNAYTLDYDFTANDQGWSFRLDQSHGYPAGSYQGALGYERNPNFNYWTYASSTYAILSIRKSISVANLISSHLEYDMLPSFYFTAGGFPVVNVSGVDYIPSSNAGAAQTGAGLVLDGHITEYGTSQLRIELVTGADVSLNTPPYWVTTGDIFVRRFTARMTNDNSKVVHSVDNGATWGSDIVVGGTPGGAGGFDVSRSADVSYAACRGKVRKATTLGGAYSDFVACTGANPVCVVIPYYRRNSTTKNTSVSNPDFLVATDAVDGDGSTLYWVDGTSGAKTDIIPVAGMTFNNASCITTSYGHHIAVWGLVGSVYKLYRSTNGGTTWTYVRDISAPHYIRGRRNDTTAVTSGTDKGQLYLIADSLMRYSSFWMPTSLSAYQRLMPETGLVAFDTIF